MNARQLIDALQLEPHPEGGYFRRTYCSESVTSGGARACMSSIFYLLTDDSPTGHLHRNGSDILHYWQGGDPLHYTVLSPTGTLTQHVLGPDLAGGQLLQMLVPGGFWKASELRSGAFGLISEAVCPGFDFADHTMAGRELLETFPQHRTTLSKLIAT